MRTTERMPVTIGIRLTSKDAAKLRALAAADDRRPSALARRLLVAALAQLDVPMSTERVGSLHAAACGRSHWKAG